MMRKKIVSLCMALVLCLGLLPATALAAEVDAPNNLYVGNQNVKKGSDTTYWNTNNSGELTQVSDATDDSNDWTVKYDPNTATLTLKNATIKTTHDDSRGAMIYAQSVGSRAVSLTIQLVGENTIVCDSAYYGIYVDAEMSNDSYGTDASLTITGNGSLEVSGSSYGIWVKSGTGNASLNIKNVAVTSSTNGDYAAGVCVQSSTKATGSPQLSLAVDGGSLTTSASEGNDGIQFYVGLFDATGATTSLTISNNAIVRANGGIKASRVDEPTPSGTGIVFDGTEGTVYGSVTLQDDLTIGAGETLTVPQGSTLYTNNNLTNNGTILASGGSVSGNLSGGTTISTPTITTQPTSQTVSEGGTSEFSVTASNAQTYQWQHSTDSGSNWTAINDATEASYTINSTTTDMSGYQYRCIVTSASGVSVISQTATLTVQAKPASVPVTGVKLNTETLELFTGNTATLTATVEPDNATNKTVTWKSSDTNIATVDTDGNVTAVGAGTATITVTTADGGKTATCTVTVKHGNMVHTPKKDATCTEAGHTEYWTCETCGKMFRDENGTNEISQESTVIPATGHTFRGGWCAVCGARDPSYVPPANPNYRIDVTTTEGGTVDKDPAAAKAGETVTLTPTPDAGYEVGNVTVTDRFGEAVAVTENADGTYTFTMPNGQVTVTVTFEQAPLPFHDVTEGDWFYDAVRYAYETGLMDGVEDSLFAPNSETTRAQLVTILYRLAGEPEPGGDSGFTDVEADTWYTDAVAWAAQNGIVNGVSDTEFAPGDDITREQLAVILYRYAAYQGYDVSQRADLSGFGDASSISGYAQEALSWAHAQGLVLGFEDGSLRPQGTASRAQIAAVLMRFLAAVPTA